MVNGGNVANDGTWLNPGVPYVTDSDVAISDDTRNPVITIAAGTTVQMEPGTEFYVGYSAPGGLIAKGTPTDSITFTSSVDPPSPGDWSRLSFYSYSVNDDCRLSYCNVWYGGSDSRDSICIHNRKPTVASCDIGYGASYGIYLEGDTTNLPDPTQLRSDNNIHDCASGDIREP